MIIIRDLDKINQQLQNCSLTLGNFDGLHIGHQKILEFTKNIAQKRGSKSALMTFEPHPKHFFGNIEERSKLYNLAQKLDILRKENLIDVVFLMRFNQELANLEAQDFVKNILIDAIKVQDLVIGYDFNFGKNRLGNFNLLKEIADKNYNLHQFSIQKDEDNQIYSSTNIRNLIKEGLVDQAAKMLGRNYSILGTVVNGKQNGRKIGFRTANILPKYRVIFPKFGVYKSIVKIFDKKYNSITNFGIKPTFFGEKALFETHIFDFNQEIYGKKIEVELLDFIRPEMKFDNIEMLKEQIAKDCQICLKNLSKFSFKH